MIGKVKFFKSVKNLHKDVYSNGEAMVEGSGCLSNLS